jgi:hypothetical protein
MTEDYGLNGRVDSRPLHRSGSALDLHVMGYAGSMISAEDWWSGSYVTHSFPQDPLLEAYRSGSVITSPKSSPPATHA